jgi:hypothetical protein
MPCSGPTAAGGDLPVGLAPSASASSPVTVMKAFSVGLSSLDLREALFRQLLKVISPRASRAVTSLIDVTRRVLVGVVVPVGAQPLGGLRQASSIGISSGSPRFLGIRLAAASHSAIVISI